MLLKLRNLPVLSRFSISDKLAIINHLFITECPLITPLDLAEDIYATEDNVLTHIRIDVSTNSDYEDLMKFSYLHGLDASGNTQDKPVFKGTWKTDQWITDEQESLAESTFDLIDFDSDHIVESSTDASWIHFTELTPPTITKSSFSIEPYATLYIGEGETPFTDNNAISLYKADSSWSTYSSKISSWYDYNTPLPNLYQKIDYVQSDGINVINTGFTFTDDTRFVVDLAFTSDQMSENCIYGSNNSGLKGGSSGLTFGFSNHTHTILQNKSWLDDTMREYDIDTSTNAIKLNGSVIYSGEYGTSLGGGISLFGIASSKFIGRSMVTKIYQGGELVAHYVPCCRKSDMYIGFYDLISKTFVGYNSYTTNPVDVNRNLTSENNENILDENGNTILI